MKSTIGTFAVAAVALYWVMPSKPMAWAKMFIVKEVTFLL